MAAKPRYLFSLAAAPTRRGQEVRSLGGKAASLLRLQRAGFVVPESWICPAEVYTDAARYLPSELTLEQLLRIDDQRGVNRVGRAHAAWQSMALPTGFDGELEQLWLSASENGTRALAVRSSATVEDGDALSMAGVAASRIGVSSAAELLEAIREVWASLATPRAVRYLGHRGIREAAMAVLVQRVVPARALGVLFTRHPLGGAGRLVNATFGLGIPLVDGRAPADSWRMDDRGRVVESQIAQKSPALVADGLSVHLATISEGRKPSLEGADLGALAELALRLERLGGTVRWDVEFAFHGAALIVLQARPITSRAFPRGGDAATVWSCANLAEALPGVATPLTWSVAGGFADKGFRAAFEALGCPVKKEAPMVGNVHGRFYLNLSQFMEIASQLPWLNPRLLIELGGGAGTDELASERREKPTLGQLARLPFMGARLLETQLGLDSAVDAYVREAERFSERFSALELAILPDSSLGKSFRELQGLLDRTGTAMLTCAASALGAYLALRLLLERTFPVEGDGLAQALTTGIQDLPSVQPSLALLQLAELVAATPHIRDAILRSEITAPEHVHEPSVRAALTDFLARFGHRAIREAELCEPRWTEDPSSLFAMLRVTLRQDLDVELPFLASRKLAVKTRADQAEAKVRSAVGPATLLAVRVLVGRAKRAARHREVMRVWVTRVLGRIREAALVADARLRRRHPDLENDMRKLHGYAAVAPVFLLTANELVESLDRGRSDVVSLVRARRVEWIRDNRRPAPPTTFVGSPPPPVVVPRESSSLQGIPASAGVVEGTARIVLSAASIDRLEPGDILVTPTTDTAWTPLFLDAVGVVTELGGSLSHAAIVARELGVPAVVNVEGATVRIRDGERIRIDGSRGTVERLDGRQS